MRKISKFLLPFFLCLFVISCSQGFNDEKSSIKVTLPRINKTSESRNVSFDELKESNYFTIKLSNENIAIYKNGIEGDTVIFDELNAGTYKVECYTGIIQESYEPASPDGKGTSTQTVSYDCDDGFYYGNTSVKVKAGETAKANLKLKHHEPTTGNMDVDTISGNNQITAHWQYPYASKKATLALVRIGQNELGENFESVKAIAQEIVTFERNANEPWLENTYTFKNLKEKQKYTVALFIDEYFDDTEVNPGDYETSDIIPLYSNKLNLALTAAETSITATWDKLSSNDSIGYAVIQAIDGKTQYSETDFGTLNTFTNYNQDALETTEMLADNLEKATKYVVFVKVTKEDGSVVSEWKTVTTQGTKGESGSDLEGENFNLQTTVNDNTITASWLYPYGAKKVTLVLCPYSNELFYDEETGQYLVDVSKVYDEETCEEKEIAAPVLSNLVKYSIKTEEFERNSDNKWNVNSYTFTDVERLNGYYVAIYAENEDSEIIYKAVSEMLRVYSDKLNLTVEVSDTNTVKSSWCNLRLNSYVYLTIVDAVEGKNLTDYTVDDFTADKEVRAYDDIKYYNGSAKDGALTVEDSSTIGKSGKYVVGVKCVDENESVIGFECKFVEIEAAAGGTDGGEETTAEVTISYKGTDGKFVLGSSYSASDFDVTVNNNSVTASEIMVTENAYGTKVPVIITVGEDSKTYMTTMPVYFNYPEIKLYAEKSETIDGNVTKNEFAIQDSTYEVPQFDSISITPKASAKYMYYGDYSNEIDFSGIPNGYSFISSNASDTNSSSSNSSFVQLKFSEAGDYIYYCKFTPPTSGSIPGMNMCLDTTVTSNEYKVTVYPWEVMGIYDNGTEVDKLEQNKEYKIRIKNEAATAGLEKSFSWFQSPTLLSFGKTATFNEDEKYYETTVKAETNANTEDTDCTIKVQVSSDVYVNSYIATVKGNSQSGGAGDGEYLSLGDTAPTTAGKYAIASKTDFDNFASWTKTNSFEGYEFVLTDNIKLSDTSSTAILSSSSLYPFKGTFNGNEKSISNINITSTQDGVGLFGNIGDGAYIKDLEVSGQVTTTYSSLCYAGGIAGRVLGGSAISNCVSNVKVTGSGACVGGIVGGAGNDDNSDYTGLLSIADCINKGEITGYSRTGGIIGDTYYITVNIKNVANLGTVTVSANFAGGIMGSYNDSNKIPSLTNCVNYGTITDKSSSPFAGGVFGGKFGDTTDTVYSFLANCYYLSTSYVQGIGSMSDSDGVKNWYQSITKDDYSNVLEDLNTFVEEGNKQWSIKTVTIGGIEMDVPLF